MPTFDPRYNNPYDPASGLRSEIEPAAGGGADSIAFQADDPDDDDVTEFKIGADNKAFLESETADPLAWIDNLQDRLWKDYSAAGRAAGEDPYTTANTFSAIFPQLVQDIDTELFQGNATSGVGKIYGKMTDFVNAAGGNIDGNFYVNTSAGFNAMYDYAENWMKLKQPKLQKTWGSTGGGGGGGGGGGSRVPTEAEIRAKFDLDQLAAAAQDIWRGNVLDEHKDPRSIARSYVDAVVASGGEQAIDFNTFVEKRVMDTARYKSIYRDKPDSMTPQQYLMPYFQSAQNVLGAKDQAANIAIGGAQFGASAQAFQARLDRETRGAAPFMQQLETSARGLRGVFKG